MSLYLKYFLIKLFNFFIQLVFLHVDILDCLVEPHILLMSCLKIATQFGVFLNLIRRSLLGLKKWYLIFKILYNYLIILLIRIERNIILKFFSIFIVLLRVKISLFNYLINLGLCSFQRLLDFVVFRFQTIVLLLVIKTVLFWYL